MRRGIVVVWCALLLAAAPIAVASTPFIIAQDTTATEFSGGTQTNATVVGSGAAADVVMGVADRGPDDTNESTTNRVGLVIEPKHNTSSVTINLSEQTTGATTAYLTDTNGTVLDKTSITGDVVTLSASLAAGTQYRVLVDAGGNSFTVGTGAANYPYSGGGVAIVNGYSSGSSSTDSFAIRSVAIGGISAASTSGTHKSQFNVSGSSAAAVNLTLTNSEATVTVVAAATGNTLANTTITASGNTTIAYPETSGDVNITVTGAATGESWTTRVHDITVVDATAPSASDVAPADGTQTTTADTEFNLTVSDADFDHNDTVTATLYVRAPGASGYSERYQTTIAANQTISTTETLADAGDYEYYWALVDSYGKRTETSVRTVSTPATLTIRNETNASQRITGSSVTVTFYSDDGQTVITRNDSDGDGTINMSGLPANTKYSAVVEADGYIDRSVFIGSLFEQQQVFLLNKTVTTADVVFSLDDATSRFGQATTIYVERAITLNGSTSYQVVTSGQLGATGELATTLQDDTRYRIRVVNGEGETRVLGSYVTNGDDAAVLPIGQVRINADVPQGDIIEGKLIKASGQRAVRLIYLNPNGTTQELTINVTNLDTNEVLEPTTTESGPFGRFVATYPVNSSAPPDSTWQINVSVTFADGGTYDTSFRVGGVTGFTSLPVSDRILSLTGWALVLSMTGLVVIRSPTHAPITAAAVGGAVTVLGVTSIPLPALGLAGAIGVITVMEAGS